MTYEHLALAFIHPHQIDAGFVTSLWRTVAQLPGLRVVDMGSGPMIASARNEIALTFLDTDAEFLLMADADMVFTPAQVKQILELGDEISCPIVGGLCFVVGRAGILEPTIKVTDPVNGGLRIVHDYPEDALVSCDATGTAFLLVHRAVFESLRGTYGDQSYPFFADSAHGGLPWGEDVTFCIRARQHGFPVKVHTGISIGHIKPYVYTDVDYREQRARIAVVGEDAVKHETMIRQGFAERTELEKPMNRKQRRQLARAR